MYFIQFYHCSNALELKVGTLKSFSISILFSFKLIMRPNILDILNENLASYRAQVLLYIFFDISYLAYLKNYIEFDIHEIRL